VVIFALLKILVTIQPMQNRHIDIYFNVIDKCKYQPVEKRNQSPTINENQSKELTDKFLEEVKLLNENITSAYEIEYNKFITQYEIVDTIEASKSTYSEKKITAEQEEFDKKFKEAKKGSQLYFEAVFDRIEYYKDLLWFTNLLISKSFTATNEADKYSLETIYPKIKAIIDVISKLKSSINDKKNDFGSIVETEKNLLLDTLDRKIIVDL